MGTPSGSSHSGAIAGSAITEQVNRELGCAAGSGDDGLQGVPCQSVSRAGGSLSPSHHTSPSSVNAVLVKMVFDPSASRAFGFVCSLVPGATPKNPASGLIARNIPSVPIFIQQISSPIVSIFHPGRLGIIIARLVLPHAEGNAPVI